MNRKPVRKKAYPPPPSQYWSVLGAGPLGAAFGIVLGFVLPQIMPNGLESMQGLFQTIALGVGLSTGLAGMFILNHPALRIASAILPGVLAYFSVTLVYTYSHGSNAIGWAVATFVIPAVTMGILAGVAKHSLRGFILGTIGGALAAAAAFAAFLAVDKSGLSIPIKFVGYFAVSAGLIQSVIALAMSFVSDPEIPKQPEDNCSDVQEAS